MSLLRRLLPDREEARSNYWPRDALHYSMPTASGQVVTPESAARSAAVTACQRVLTTTVASLPVDAIRMEGGARRQVTPEPAIVRSPSGRVRRRAFVAQVMKSMLGNGNGYAQIVSLTPRGFAQQMETLHFRDVSWQKNQAGQLKPFVNHEEHDLWPVGDILHIPASPFIQPGSPVADSPVELAKQSIGVGLAAEEFGARFFGDGYHPTVVAKSDKDLTQEQAGAIKAAINRMRTNREPGVFGTGLDLEHWDVKPDDSQFIDLMRFEVEQACRFFGVPPSMAYAAVSGQNVTYANVSQADLQYLKHSVGIWLLDIEDAWSSLLPAPQVVKFNVDALLRMDAAARHELYKVRLDSKTISVNDIKALEDEAPYGDPEFDKPGIPGAPPVPVED